MEKTVNRVEIMGRVGVEPKISTFEDGRQVIRLSVATEETFKDRSGELRQETTWHTIVAWRGKEMPQFAEIKKGQCISAIGKIKNRSFEGRDGQTRYYYEIVAHTLKVVSGEELE